MLETGRQDKELEGLSLLGNQGTKYKFGYDPNILEVFDNKHPNNDYFVKFNCPEFTSLCPITGQPDFATIYISYIPGEKMVENVAYTLNKQLKTITCVDGTWNENIQIYFEVIKFK